MVFNTGSHLNYFKVYGFAPSRIACRSMGKVLRAYTLTQNDHSIGIQMLRPNDYEFTCDLPSCMRGELLPGQVDVV